MKLTDEQARAMASRLVAYCERCDGLGSVNGEECRDCAGRGYPPGLPPLSEQELDDLVEWTEPILANGYASARQEGLPIPRGRAIRVAADALGINPATNFAHLYQLLVKAGLNR